MSHETWGWYAGWTEEEMTVGPEDSREAIIEAATGDEIGFVDADDDGPDRLCFHIMEARKTPLDPARLINIDALWDGWENGIFYDLAGEDAEHAIADHITAAQKADLGARLKEAAREWAERNNVTIMPWIFTETRNAETVTVIPDADSPDEENVQEDQRG